MAVISPLGHDAWASGHCVRDQSVDRIEKYEPAK